MRKAHENSSVAKIISLRYKTEISQVLYSIIY